MPTYSNTMLLEDKVSTPLKKIQEKAEQVQKSTEKVTQSTEKLNKKYNVLQRGIRNIEAGLIKFDKKLRDTGNQLDKFKKRTEHIGKLGEKIKGIGQSLTVGVTLPIVGLGGAMVKLASDMEETINKVDVSFGKSSDKVKEWAKNSVTNMGLAQQTALDSAALYGDMATGMGMAQNKAADMAMALTQLGADLASFKNISNEMAQTALKSIFTGETESLKNLGIVMTENNLTRFAASRGIRKQMKDMSDLEKIQLRYNYVMSQTVNAQGDFVRTGGGAANQTRMFQEQLKEIGVTFGQYILPYFTNVIIKLNDMLKAFNNLSPQTKKTILIIAGIAAAIGPLLSIVGSLITAVAGLNIVLMYLAANPIILTITGITAAVWLLIKAIEFLIKKLIILKGQKLSGASFNLENEENLKYWSEQKRQMGAKEFNKKYDRSIQKAVSNYEKNDNRNYQTNSNNTTSNTTNNIKHFHFSWPWSGQAQYANGN